MSMFGKKKNRTTGLSEITLIFSMTQSFELLNTLYTLFMCVSPWMPIHVNLIWNWWGQTVLQFQKPWCTKHQSSFFLCFWSSWLRRHDTLSLLSPQSQLLTPSQPMHTSLSPSTNMLSRNFKTYNCAETAAVTDHYTFNMKRTRGTTDNFLLLKTDFCTDWWTGVQTRDISEVWSLQFLKIDWMEYFPTGFGPKVGLEPY